jgi:hypothetical protein
MNRYCLQLGKAPIIHIYMIIQEGSWLWQSLCESQSAPCKIQHFVTTQNHFLFTVCTAKHWDPITWWCIDEWQKPGVAQKGKFKILAHKSCTEPQPQSSPWLPVLHHILVVSWTSTDSAFCLERVQSKPIILMMAEDLCLWQWEFRDSVSDCLNPRCFGSGLHNTWDSMITYTR